MNVNITIYQCLFNTMAVEKTKNYPDLVDDK